MHADVFWTSPPPDPVPDSNKGNAYVDIAKITVLLVFSAVIQFCSLFVLYLMADKISALLNAYMIVHYEKIAKWKYGGKYSAREYSNA